MCWRFRRFVRRLLFRTIHGIALMLDRERAGRDASPPHKVYVNVFLKVLGEDAFFDEIDQSFPTTWDVPLGGASWELPPGKVNFQTLAGPVPVNRP